MSSEGDAGSVPAWAQTTDATVLSWERKTGTSWEKQSAPPEIRDPSASLCTPLLFSLADASGSPLVHAARSERHASMQDAGHIAARHGSREHTPSSSGRPQSREPVSAAAMWIDRKPQDFIRAFRKSQSVPTLIPPSGSGATKPARRKGDLRANEIIANQQKSDEAKKQADLTNAERDADRMRREHSILVSERVKKTARMEALKDQLGNLNVDVRNKEDEYEALSSRLAVLQVTRRAVLLCRGARCVVAPAAGAAARTAEALAAAPHARASA